ncbi:MAG: S9 family peptidase [Brevundimonas sp.]|nr:MAG: S9 family peptidase [Brevundimonas sp.]
MIKLFKPLMGALLALACLASSASAEDEAPGRQITVTDITELESFGRASISPDGRWAVYEKRGPYDTAARFDQGERAMWTIMDLWLVDLSAAAPAPARLLPNEGLGLLRVAWSPDSRRLLIARRQAEIYEYGVVSVQDRSVSWTGLTPEFSRTGAVAEWLSPDTVALSIRPDHSLPEYLRYDGGMQARMTDNWRRSAQGREPSRQVVEAREGVVTTETPSPQGALVLLDVRDGAVRTLAHAVINDFAVSPDKRRIAVVTSGEPIPAMGPMVQLEGPNRRRLSLIDLGEDRVLQPLPGKDLALSLLRWSPDSSAVLVWARDDGKAWSEGQLLQVRDEGARPTPLGGLMPGDDRQTNANLRADWIGDVPALFARPSRSSRFDWHLLPAEGPPVNLTGQMSSAPTRILSASRDALRVVADGGIWRLDARGAERLTATGIALTASVPGEEAVRRVSSNEAPGREWTPVTDEAGASLVWSNDAGLRRLGGDRRASRVMAVSETDALVLERIGLEETLWLRRNGAGRRLDAVNSSKRDVSLIEPVAIRHPGVNGAEVTDWLYLPPGRSREDLRGLIVQVYPGRTDSFVWYDPITQTYGTRPTVLAGAGFAVLSPAAPRDTPPDARGDEYVRVVDLAVDAALAAHPELPSDRIGILGHSFGGYMAMEIAVRSDRYQSYVASSGLYDMIGLWGEIDPAMRTQPEDAMAYRSTQALTEVGQTAMKVPPWGAPQAYLDSSPVMRVGAVTAPVLLLTADLDFVPMSQAEMMFSALYREGKTARMVTYWGEHHQTWSPANIRDRYQEIFDWFDETLTGGRVVTHPVTVDAPRREPMTHRPPPP